MGDLSWEERLETSARRFWPWMAVIALVLGMQIKWWWQDPDNDSTAYLSAARHFAHGEVLSLGSPHLRYLPGYPLLISPLFLFSDRPFLLIAVLHWLLALAAAAGIYVWFGRLRIGAAGPLTALVMVNAGLWNIYRQVLSETAFMAGLVWAAYALERVMASPSLRRTAAWTALSVPVLVWLSCTRHAGLLLAVGFGLTMLVRAWAGRDSWARALVVSVAVSLPVILAVGGLAVWDHAMMTRIKAATTSYDYEWVKDSGPLWQQMAEGLRRTSGECGRLLFPGMWKSYAGKGDWLNVNTLIYGVFAVCVGAGWWNLLRRRVDPLLCMLPFYVMLHVMLPWDAGTRYLLPVLPVLWACAWTLLERFGRQRYGLVAVLIVLHLAASVVYWVRDFKSRQWHADWPAVAEVLRVPPAEVRAIGVYCVPWQEAMMLRLQADRRLPIYRESGPVDAALERLIVTAGGPVPPGFVDEYSAGGLKRMRRKETPPAQPSPGGRSGAQRD